MREGAWILGAFASAALLSCGSSSQSSSKPVDPAAGTFHVRDGFVRDPQGRSVILRGVNLAGAHKSPPYFGFHQPDDYVRVSRDWGMNALRFLVVWAAIEPQKGVYDDAYLDAVAQRMDWAKQAGLMVVLDMHQDVYGEGFSLAGGDGAPKWTCDASHYAAFVPKTPWFLSYSDPNVVACYDGFWNDDELQSHYVEAWRRLAARVASSSVVVGFDPMNEPFWGSFGTEFETTRLVPLYAKVVTAVRSVAPTWIAFAEPSSAHNLGLGTHIESFPFDNVAFAPHSYDSTAESGGGFNPKGHDVLVETIASYEDEAKSLNTALWIGEYGGPPNPGIDSYMDAEYQGHGSIAAGSTYWAYDEDDTGYGLLMGDGTEKKAIVDAVVRPAPDRVAGDPVSWTFDAATSTFVLTYAPDRSIADPTIVSVPPRVYPGGYRVDCGGCASQPTTGALQITKPGDGDTVTVTLRPM